MPPAPLVDAPPTPGIEPSSARPKVGHWRWIRLGLLATVVTFFLGQWVADRLDEERQRQPLQAIERASHEADKPIGILSPSVAERWSAGDSPREAQVRELVKPGNVYLEPIFFWLHGSDGMFAAGDRCYFFAVQHGQTFDAERVSALMRICYVDGFRSPQSSSWIAVDQ